MSHTVKKLFIACSLATVSSNAFAAAFQLFEYSGWAMGNYGAGGAAIAEDASTTFTNPAGLVRLPNKQIVIAATGIAAESDYKGTACGGLGCVQVPAKKDGGKSSVVPATHYSMPINEKWWAGVGLTVPYGLSTDYGKNSLLSYSASKSEIKTINLNPVIAFKANDILSFGAGINAQYFAAELNSELTLTPALYPNSSVKNTADDVSYGWNVGALAQFPQGTRAGISFTSQMIHNLEGDSKTTGGTIPFLKSKNLKARVALPPTTIASIFHQVNEQWSVMATAIYTRWSNIDNVVLKNHVIPGVSLVPIPTPAGPAIIPVSTATGTGTVVLPQDYRNTWRFAAGVDFKVNPQLTLRAGGGYDQTPVRNVHRTIRLADGDRTAAAVGASYRVNKKVKLDAGYTHLFIKNGRVNQIGLFSKTTGKSRNKADLLGLQLNYDLV